MSISDDEKKIADQVMAMCTREFITVMESDVLETDTINQLRTEYPAMTSGDIQSMVLAIKAYRTNIVDRLLSFTKKSEGDEKIHFNAVFPSSLLHDIDSLALKKGWNRSQTLIWAAEKYMKEDE